MFKINKFIKYTGLFLSTLGLVACSGGSAAPEEAKTDELTGEIVMWHSFTQGPRLESIQKSADEFMEQNPNVKIKIETFSWNDFYTKWTTGVANGNVPDLSTALPGHVMEMINSDAIIPLNDSIENIGKERFNETALNEAKIGEDYYSIPLYSHAQVMWVRTDLLKEKNIEVPKTWDELFEASKKLTEGDVYGMSVPFGTNDLMGTRFLNFYVRSGGGSLITDDLKVDLTSKLAQDGIKYWVKMYNEVSPKDSLNFNVLQQATLFYQGKTAFDFNSGFHIGGVQANSPHLLDAIDAYPIPKINEDDKSNGLETSNIPMVVWKKSKHPEVAKAFLEYLYEDENYLEFLDSTPVGMLPAVSGITDLPAYQDNETRQKFKHAEEVILEAVKTGTAIGYENKPSVQAGLLTNQHIIEQMFQEIITNGKDPLEAAKDAEKQLNDLFESVAINIE
ncbi:TPA: sugar ABC transporter substrate-binding protein [Streptococcus suis]|uniref:ABC transporter substrate-binding protein-sugar transport, putative n=1 Tax=Streptococcus suis TaxID=1307 RepID=A0A0Z8C712_STRSU|nr:sugar ABC transporter substrate-binding protein [Streptococcus suis]MCK4041540.1 sugar ABC transporter substrate-binding protein [Streptococcus suis]NQI12483.1 sugar ABC transporter substrate-binding protein [Streptococcus suis]NQS07369.1 sugar ABC transporter substrate-binding protein [Streptococcus suis]TII06628.1 sugar ABC transporter substrate-binding protein [Streptococcus suis]CYU19899.1 ABC transporter substrate-binding protein-sugar transport%2C putative [Streptococcus suis]